ncbi:hypothetical protein QKC54_gp0197 [Megavirus baoshan]|uniref:Uncharacterized protein n=1 Tax=Megavirus baoshan TaxID=2496520 RepID=A0A8K1W7I2_9VIRU|nr:hypothetical protein QKC54_gp0197 [Megavirus baoshan]UFX99880.1 hypothetical protein Mb0875 [Megavirus baoshan]
MQFNYKPNSLAICAISSMMSNINIVDLAQTIMNTGPESYHLQTALNKIRIKEKMVEDIFSSIIVFSQEEYYRNLGLGYYNYVFKLPEIFCFGGYCRDAIATRNKLSFQDLDIRFESKGQVARFIANKLIPKYNMLKVDEISGSFYTGCDTVHIQHKEYPEVFLKLDLVHGDHSHTGKSDYFDFDVNMLKTKKPMLDNMDLVTINNMVESINPDCDINSIIKHCMAKEFVVLSNHGQSLLKHTPNIAPTFHSGRIVGFNKTMSNDCIDRKTKRGRILLDRKIKMEARGWKCINSDCENPKCVLASQSTVNKYETFLNRLDFEKDQILQKLDQYDHIEIKMSNRMHYESTKDSHKIKKIKTQIIKAHQDLVKKGVIKPDRQDKYRSKRSGKRDLLD